MPTTSICRLDIPNKETHLVNSAIAVNNGTKNMIIDSPLNGRDIETDDIKERLEELLYRCMNYTSKFVNICELTGKQYKDNLYLYILRGTNAISEHHCAGSIQFHESNEHMLFWLELLFWESYSIIHNHSLIDKTINIRRSSGTIQDGFVKKKPFRWSNTWDSFIINIGFMDGDDQKFKSFKMIDILELNPDITLDLIVPDIKNYELPDWVKFVYDTWIQFIKQNIPNSDRINLKIEN